MRRKQGCSPPTPNDSRVFHISGNHGSPQSGAQRMGLTLQNHLGDHSSFICQVGTHCHRHLDGLQESCPGQASICHSHNCSAKAVAWQPGTPRSLTSQEQARRQQLRAQMVPGPTIAQPCLSHIDGSNSHRFTFFTLPREREDERVAARDRSLTLTHKQPTDCIAN